MSTSSTEQRLIPNQGLAPRSSMSITEVILGGVFSLMLFLIGPIGFHTHHWSNETGALLGAGGAVVGLILWAVVHAALVRLGMIRPIDTSLGYEKNPKPYGRR